MASAPQHLAQLRSWPVAIVLPEPEQFQLGLELEPLQPARLLPARFPPGLARAVSVLPVPRHLARPRVAQQAAVLVQRVPPRQELAERGLVEREPVRQGPIPQVPEHQVL